MQEEAGGVENVAVENDSAVAENQVETNEQKNGPDTAETVDESAGRKAKKKSGSKKAAKIPTVEDIVLSEGAEDYSEPASGPEQTEGLSDQVQELGEKSVADSQVELDSDESFEEAEKDRLEQKRSELNLDSETALLETVLFLESEPQPPETLAKITQLEVDTVNQCIERLKEKYSNSDSGIELSMIIGGWILTPKKESFDLVKERYGKKNEGRLSKAAIETLSIIAYSQPITRAEIESIRHVSADNMMKILLDRKFIKEVGKKDIPGKPVMYGTTKEFLEFFHLQSIADLPQLDEKESERFELAR